MAVRILQGDVRDMLRTIPDASIQTCVTSPPYFQLRRYLDPGSPLAEFELGSEPTPAEFIKNLVGVFDIVRDKLRADATLWVNLGDSYAGSGKGPTGHNGIGDQEQRQGFTGNPDRFKTSTLGGGQKTNLNQPGLSPSVPGIPAKNLLLIPERFAIVMQDAGWWVRSRIAWCKTSAMPESVRDRPTSAWEHIWLFSKSARYFYDAEAVRQPIKAPDVVVPSGFGGHKRNGGTTYSGNAYDASQLSGANLRNYWLLGPEPSTLEHYAAYPTELVKRCILAGTSQKGACPACGAPWVRTTERVDQGWNGARYGERAVAASGGAITGGIARSTLGSSNGRLTGKSETTGWAPSCTCDAGEPVPCVVLDPFLGSGTTAMVADRLQRDAIGIELSPAYVKLAEQRLQRDAGPMFADSIVVAS